MSQLLSPIKQGHIDGLCGVYAVLNACRLVGVAGDSRISVSSRWDQSLRLFRALCMSERTRGLFPGMVCDGTEAEGIEQLLLVAQQWAPRHSLVSLHVEEPQLPCAPQKPKAYFDALRDAMRVKRGERKAFILGLAPPWDHWTVIRRVRTHDALFFDSWSFPAANRVAAPFGDFLCKGKATGSEARKPYIIDPRRGFLLTSLEK